MLDTSVICAMYGMEIFVFPKGIAKIYVYFVGTLVRGDNYPIIATGGSVLIINLCSEGFSSSWTWNNHSILERTGALEI